MSESKNKKEPESRGTVDEIESLKVILEAEPLLKKKVLEKLRASLSSGKENLIEASKKRFEKTGA